MLRDLLPRAAARDAANNLLRLRVLEETYRELADLPVEFVALKGITQCELFGIRPEDRAQSDIDLYCPRETVEAVRDALIARGYRPIEGLEAFPTDHLPAMMRPTTWLWRGDFFDPEMPLAIELHFQFWNPRLERLPAEGVDSFGRVAYGARWGAPIWRCSARWMRWATQRCICSSTFCTAIRSRSTCTKLPASYTGTRTTTAFWTEWRGLHSSGLRRLQTVSFLLAEAWFGCRLRRRSVKQRTAAPRHANMVPGVRAAAARVLLLQR